jgi:hypothetical protein
MGVDGFYATTPPRERTYREPGGMVDRLCYGGGGKRVRTRRKNRPSPVRRFDMRRKKAVFSAAEGFSQACIESS